MHKNIKRFSVEGVIGDDADFARLRPQYEAMLVEQMRDAGYVPVLGMGPYFSTTFNPSQSKKNSGTYKFIMSLYGAFVGKGRSPSIEGYDVMTGRTLPRSIRQPK